MKKYLFILCALLWSGASHAYELSLTPGSFPGVIDKINNSGDSDLVLKGTATSEDLTLLRFISPRITTIDMSSLSIKGGNVKSGEWFGSTEFTDGELPAYMLVSTQVKSLKLPPGLTKIGNGAFAGTPLTEVTLKGVKEIGDAVFYGCRSLRNVDMSGTSLRELPSYSFSGCSELETVKLPSTLRVIGNHCFEKSGIKKGGSGWISEIGEYAFAFAERLTDISFSQDCKMGEGAFFGATSLEKVVGSPENIPDLFNYGGNSKEWLIINSPGIGEGAFSGSLATAIGLGDNVSEIGAYAFSMMPRLNSIDVVKCKAVPIADEKAFDGNEVGKITLHVGHGEKEKWSKSPVWCDFILTEEASKVEVMAEDGCDVEVYRNGDLVIAKATVPISEIMMFSTDGKMIGRQNPNSLTAAIPYPEGGEMVVIRVLAGKTLKIVKLMK